MIERCLIFLLFLTGFHAIIVRKNVIKKVFGLGIINSAVVILFILEGSRSGNSAPIIQPGVQDVVDPIPQALMLTAVVIGVCLTALALTLVYRLYTHSLSLHIDEIRRKIHDTTH